jgi:hypothetical protein
MSKNVSNNPKGFAKIGNENVSCCGESWKARQSSQYSNSSAGTRTRSERKTNTVHVATGGPGASQMAGSRKSHIVGHRDRD